MSYHAASGNIVVGLSGGNVEMWQTAPYIAPFTAPIQAAPQAALPAHVCVRERLAAAQEQAKEIEASIEKEKADDGLRQQMSREQELKQSIADLEAKCTHIFLIIYYYTNKYFVKWRVRKRHWLNCKLQSILHSHVVLLC